MGGEKVQLHALVTSTADRGVSGKAHDPVALHPGKDPSTQWAPKPV